MIPKISVLMSLYKESALYVSEAINSILNQTFKDYELIIINDNPKDIILDNLVKQYTDRRIRYYRNKVNLGLARSMNYAARLAKADILARMDADDIAIPERFEKQIKVLESENYDLVCSKFSKINDKGEELASECGYSSNILTNLNRQVQLRPMSIIHHPTVMFYREFFDKVGGYRDFPCAQDMDLWLRMAEAGCRIVCMPDVLLKYRINQNSISYQRHFQQQLTIYYIIELSWQRITTGVDTYSQAHYYKYLKKKGFGSDKAEKRFEKSYKFLLRSSNNKKYLIKFYYKIVAIAYNTSLGKLYLHTFIKGLLINSN